MECLISPFKSKGGAEGVVAEFTSLTFDEEELSSLVSAWLSRYDSPGPSEKNSASAWWVSRGGLGGIKVGFISLIFMDSGISKFTVEVVVS